MVNAGKFDFSTGLPALDRALQGIIKGDNVVWQADGIADYKSFVEPFCRNASAEGKRIIYLRFATHPPVVPEDLPIETHTIDPGSGFDDFISEIFRIIESSGRGTCYVFDCLSGLAASWFSDRMLGNFFMLVCPCLFDYETVTYFVLMRGAHSPYAIDAIHGTAQVVIDIFNADGLQYVLPVKVIHRHSPTLYMLHKRGDDSFEPVMRSAEMSGIMSRIPQPWIDFNVDRRDFWTRKLIEAQEYAPGAAGGDAPPSCPEQLRRTLIRMMVTRDDELFKLCCGHMDISDIISIAKRMIGTGLIGGKAAGMLLARTILEKKDPRWRRLMESHDSFYIGSDVFCTYIIQNKCWWDIRRLKRGSPEFAASEDVRRKIMDGRFPEDIVEQFREMIVYFGQSPIIVRSSSILEDAYGNAFSGKYESVFCANQGDPEQRLIAFMDAIKAVYSSTYTKTALSYREHRGLLHTRNEEMAVLVQRVSGTNFGERYFPHAAGVAYSFNPFVWNKRIDPSSGAIRLVFGLGTRAVENEGGEYTRIVALNEPLLRPESSLDEVRKYSQQTVDILHLKDNMLVPEPFEDLAAAVPDLPLGIFATKDPEIERRARDMGIKNIFSWLLTFEHLLTKTAFVEDMRGILSTVEDAYKYPVDIEFALNFIGPDEYRINVLQCRPFQCSKKLVQIREPSEIPAEKILVKTGGPIIGQNLEDRIGRIIYVRPGPYSELAEQQRYMVARLVGEISNAAPSLKTFAAGPGRWGTKMPSLGIPVSFPEIKNVCVLCEIAAMHEGLVPDISFGTHFFNDLVETGIIYMAAFPGQQDCIINDGLLGRFPNRLPEIFPTHAKWTGTIHVIDPEDAGIYVNIVEQMGILFLN